MGLVTQQKMAFGFETVFSDWRPQCDGTIASKIDTIKSLQQEGYFVVLLFVGLASLQISVARVSPRKQQGGHDVPLARLKDRFPRTRLAISEAAPIADMTLMFDNSLDVTKAFRLARVQRGPAVLYDCRHPEYRVRRDLRGTAGLWLDAVCPRKA